MAMIADIERENNTTAPVGIEQIKIPTVEEVPWDDDFVKFLSSRGLTVEIMDDVGAKPCIHYFGTRQKAFAFPYASPKSGLVYSYKVRSIETKDFRCVGTPQSLFLANKVVAGEALYICEGEFDAIALRQAGLNGTSVPHGAPDRPLSADGSSEDRKLACLWNSRAALAAASQVVVSVDADNPGQILGEEIARRLGKAKVSRVLWSGGKDANDILMAAGAEGLRQQAEAIQPWPLEGVRSVSDYEDEVLDLYRNGNAKGLSTGLPSIDPIYQVATGLLTVLTGHPASGKSEWLDYILTKLATQHDWKIAICSFENPTKIHLAKLAEKILNSPFFEGMHPRMEEDALREALRFLNRHFVFIDFSDGTPATISRVLERADLAVQRLGCRGLVIDPFNYLAPPGNDGWSPSAISDMLTEVRRFAVSHDAHVWMVAHPAKMMKVGADMPVPTGMDISGAYAWWAKCDHGLTVHRQDQKGTVLVRSWKARFKWLGSHGDVELLYDPVSGCYNDVGTAPDMFPMDFGAPVGVEPAQDEIPVPF